MDISDRCFFASANSGRGFVSLFDDIFNKCEKRYIIKGCPGCGKSYFMKQIASAAENKGYEVERYKCSSDPDSLDGIIIKELSVAVFDGTSPHTKEALYPAVYDNLIDLAGFLDSDKLKDKGKNIIRTTKYKGDCYTQAYMLLKSALTVHQARQRLSLSFVDIDKLCSFSKKLSSQLNRTEGEISGMFWEAISPKGHIRLHPYTSTAKKIYNIKDRYDIAYLLLNYINSYLDNTQRCICYSCLDAKSISAIYLKGSETLLSVNEATGKTVNTQRFVIKDEYDRVKEELWELKRIERSCINNAVFYLEKASGHHRELEEIYNCAMNIRNKEEYAKRFIKELFS